MSYREKQIVAFIFSFVLVFGIYFSTLYAMHQNGRFEGADAMALLGQSVLVLIATSIVVTIVVTIAFNIVYAIAKKERNPSYVVDERDRLIELRGSHVSDVVCGIGFVLSMVAMSLGYSTFLVFNVIVASFALGSVMSSVVQLLIYRKGF